MGIHPQGYFNERNYDYLKYVVIYNYFCCISIEIWLIASCSGCVA